MKKILVCVVVGLTLGACNPSESNYAGDDGNPNTNGNGAYQVPESGMVLKGVGQKGLQTAGIGVSLLQLGIKAAASSLGTSVGKGVLAQFLGDPNQKLYDRFDQVDTKLAEINKNLETQLKLNAQTLATLNKFYLEFANKSLEDKLSDVNGELKEISTRNSLFNGKNVYGSLDNTELDKIYSNVQTHKDYPTLITVGVTNADKIDSKGAKQNKALNLDPVSTENLYVTFQNTFINDVSKSGNVINAFQGDKAAFLSRLATVGLLDNQDMMMYVNGYNYNIMNIRLQLLTSLQKLYNMQLVQLAYYYGAKANLDVKFTSSDPANPMPAQNQGLDGFKKAAQMLFNTYEADLNNLNQAFATYLPFITESDVARQINFDWFDYKQALLFDQTFLQSIDESAPLPLSNRQCEVTGLTFNSIGDSINKYGLVNLGINCYLGNGTWKSANVVFPAVKDGAKIVRYAYHTIYVTSSQKLSIGSFSTAPRQLTPDDIKAFAEQTSSKDSIKDGNIKDLIDRDTSGYGYDWVKKSTDKKDMVLFSPAKDNSGGLGVDWAAGDFELKDNRNEITRILPVTYYDGDKGGSLNRTQTNRNHSINDEVIYNMRFSQEVKAKDDSRGAGDPVTYFYNLASYRNHWFVIKMSMGYVDARAVQSLGIGCIDSACSRVSNTTLKWSTSGVEVKLTPPPIKNNATAVRYSHYNGEEFQTLISGTGK
mgnify:CR=1 FL=1